ncbi:hypothetical protein ON010_g16193 [Phytophthora cinnamomi]|nr:hypothetical protein ON010_g16193 [Phytophthora cinnamomi]
MKIVAIGACAAAAPGRPGPGPDHPVGGLRGVVLWLLPALGRAGDDQLLQPHVREAHGARAAAIHPARGVQLPRVRAPRRPGGHRGVRPGVPAARGLRAAQQAHGRVRQDQQWLEDAVRLPAGVRAALHGPGRVPGPVQGRQDLGHPEGARRDHRRAVQDHRQRAGARREAGRPRVQVTGPQQPVQGLLQASQEDQLVLRGHVRTVSFADFRPRLTIARVPYRCILSLLVGTF